MKYSTNFQSFFTHLEVKEFSPGGLDQLDNNENTATGNLLLAWKIQVFIIAVTPAWVALPDGSDSPYISSYRDKNTAIQDTDVGR